MSANRCRRCGHDAGPDVPRPDRCGSCLPRPCPDCGKPDNAPCDCYIDLTTLSLADVKAVLASADLSMEWEAGR